MNRLVADTDVIEALRALMPNRALEWSESHSIAERQALLLLELLHIDEPCVPQFAVSSLPGVVVDRRRDWPTSGMTINCGTYWRIVLNASEPRQRVRFSLGHEFKHVVDDPFVERIYAALPEEDRVERAERLCNYFAACLLMPRSWVKSDGGRGVQRAGELARRYYVSTEAMQTRLSELGLVASPTRRRTNDRRPAHHRTPTRTKRLAA